MAVRVVLLADWMAMIGVRVPLQSPATVYVTVVLAEEEEEGAGERRHECDVGERAADEVVTALHRPVDQVVQAGSNGHHRKASDVTGGCRPQFPATPIARERRKARRTPGHSRDFKRRLGG